MIKLQIMNSMKMQWESGYKKVFPNAVWSSSYQDDFDITLWMWCDDYTIKMINESRRGKHIVFIRRYEVYADNFLKMDWGKVNKIIMVNDYLADIVEEKIKIKPIVIYNGVCLDKWTFKERSKGKQIALVGFINQKKNIPLALQIMEKLPRNYELHLAGGLQDPSVMVYIDNFSRSTGIKVVWNDHIPERYMDKWLEDKNFLISTAISEGCPNNIIEAMAKGIKPIIHNWPGAKEQFGDLVFNTVDDAVSMIESDEYNSKKYNGIVREKFGDNNFNKVKNIVESIWIEQ